MGPKPFLPILFFEFSVIDVDPIQISAMPGKIKIFAYRNLAGISLIEKPFIARFYG